MQKFKQFFFGPYNSQGFFDYLLDDGKPWLCMTLQFPDRLLDLVGQSDEQVTEWILGLQSLMTLSANQMSKGLLMWRRLILKLNYYGLDPTYWPGTEKECIDYG